MTKLEQTPHEVDATGVHDSRGSCSVWSYTDAMERPEIRRWLLGIEGRSRDREMHADESDPPDDRGDVSDETEAPTTKRLACVAEALRRRFGEQVWVVDTSRTSRRALRGGSSRWLVVAGDVAALQLRQLCVVGTRRAGRRGVELARRVVDDARVLGPISLLSGGALGVDAAAHAAALDRGMVTVAWLAGGLLHVGPRTNRDLFGRIVASGGALVTERPPDAKPQRFEFIRRNDRMAALASAVVVVRAPASSGALRTARQAFRLGRPVLAVPHAPDDPSGAGCLSLLRRGARICAGPEDLAALGASFGALDGAAARLAAPREDERSVTGGPAAPTGDGAVLLEKFDGQPITLDQLCRRVGWSTTRVSSALLELELSGAVVALGGGHFRLTTSRVAR